ncbi:hypothetical protein QTP88_009224 [Uroleucon formosanum]
MTFAQQFKSIKQLVCIYSFRIIFRHTYNQSMMDLIRYNWAPRRSLKSTGDPLITFGERPIGEYEGQRIEHYVHTIFHFINCYITSNLGLKISFLPNDLINNVNDENDLLQFVDDENEKEIEKNVTYFFVEFTFDVVSFLSREIIIHYHNISETPF